jgi:hypothetical protein
MRLDISFENTDELLNLAKRFNSWARVELNQQISFDTHGYYGLKPKLIEDYFKDYFVSIKINAGKHSVTKDIFVEYYSPWALFSDSVTIEIRYVPTDELSTIGSIDAEVVYGHKSNTNDAPFAKPAKKNKLKKRATKES